MARLTRALRAQRRSMARPAANLSLRAVRDWPPAWML